MTLPLSQARAEARPPDWRRWLFDGALPFWAEAGCDRQHGGFHERLDAAGRPFPGDAKRIVVQMRQTYVFSHAAVMSGDPRLLDVARHGWEFWTRHGWHPENGGWVHALTGDGGIADARRDCYDHAFALFCCAWYARASGETAPLDLASRTIEWMDGHLADTVDGGFLEALEDVPGRRPRRQNPHMHLFEALSALYELTGEQEWRRRAEQMLDLLADRFVQPDGTLAEYFTQDWRPEDGMSGRIREPGHHFEWVWLLHRWGGVCDTIRYRPIADRLFDWALTHGVDTAEGMVFAPFDAVDPDGQVLRATKRLWPQTEFIKACVVRADAGDTEAASLADRQLESMWINYLQGQPGLWRDRLERDGAPVSTDSPASSFYHLFLCLSEVLRLKGE